jgi:serine/threonine-protein kinase
MYQKALELDSNFALAYANLSIAHARAYLFFQDRTEERLDKSKRAADKALQLNPDLPEAHLALGYYHYWGRMDYERALQEFAIAQKSQPNNSDLLAGIGYVQRRQGSGRKRWAISKGLSSWTPAPPRWHLRSGTPTGLSAITRRPSGT